MSVPPQPTPAHRDALTSATGVPGPADRVHFLDAQRRARRAGWPATLFALVAVLLAGVPLSAIVTPILYVPLLAAGLLADALGLLPAVLRDALHDAAHLVPIAWGQLFGRGGAVDWGFLALLLVLPGAVVMLVVWLATFLALRPWWPGGVLRRLHARRADPRSPAERRLVHVVEELAVAAAIRPPRVLVAEIDAHNALVLGHDPDRATIVVARPLLDVLGRDELQAVAATSIASIANGDLRIAGSFLSVFQAWGAVGLLADALLSPRDTRALRFVAGTVWQALRPWNRVPETRAVRRARRRAADVVLARATTEGGAFGGGEHVLQGITRMHPMYGCLVLLPLLCTLGVASIVFRAALELCTVLVFGPAMAWLWRSRRRLADATAVELLRDPDALVRAVQACLGPPGVAPEAAPFSFLCFVRATVPIDRQNALTERVAVTDFVVGMQPDPEDRLARLQALGAGRAEVPAAARTKPDTWEDVRFVLYGGVVAVLLVAALMLVNLLTTAALLWLVWVVLGFLLVTVPRGLLSLAGVGS